MRYVENSSVMDSFQRILPRVAGMKTVSNPSQLFNFPILLYVNVSSIKKREKVPVMPYFQYKSDLLLTTLTLVFAAALTACGGGGSNQTSASQPAPTTSPTTVVPAPQVITAAIPTERGTFRDAPVAGLRYESVSPSGSRYSGITDAGGGFLFHPGGSILFFYGSTELGSVVNGASIISVADIARNDAEKINIAVLLQSADTDKNSANGLSMPAVAADAKAPVLFLNFRNSSTTSFNFQLVAAAGAAGISSVVSSEVASEHSEQSDRLSAIQDTALWKAVAGTYTYNPTFNTELLNKSEKARVRLHYWQTLFAPQLRDDSTIISNTTTYFDESNKKIQKTAAQFQTALDMFGVFKAAADARKPLKAGQRYFWKVAQQNAVGWKICGVSWPEGTPQPPFSTACSTAVFDAAIDSGDAAGLAGGTIGKTLLTISNDVGPDAIAELFRAVSYTIVASPSTVTRKIVSNVATPDFYIKKAIDVYRAFINIGLAYGINLNASQINGLLAAQTYLEAYYTAAGDREFMARLLSTALKRSVSADPSSQIAAARDYYKGDATAMNAAIASVTADMNTYVRWVESQVGNLSNEKLEVGVFTSEDLLARPPVASWNLTGNSNVSRCFIPSAQGNQDLSGGGLSYAWTVGRPDGTTSSLSGIKYTNSTTPFTSAGKYSVELIVKSASGLTSQLRTVLLVSSPVNVSGGTTRTTGENRGDTITTGVGTVTGTVSGGGTRPVGASVSGTPITVSGTTPIVAGPVSSSGGVLTTFGSPNVTPGTPGGGVINPGVPVTNVTVPAICL